MELCKIYGRGNKKKTPDDDLIYKLPNPDADTAV